MLVRSHLPWRDVDDFRRYRPEVVAFLAAAANPVLSVDRSVAPYRWVVRDGSREHELLTVEAGLRRYFSSSIDSVTTVTPAGHSAEVPAQSAWTGLQAGLLLGEQARYADACRLADTLNALMPASAAPSIDLSSLSPLAQSALRTISFESPLRMCQELAAVARELISQGYATVDYSGILRVRGQWEFEQGQRKLERVRQEFAV